MLIHNGLRISVRGEKLLESSSATEMTGEVCAPISASSLTRGDDLEVVSSDPNMAAGWRSYQLGQYYLRNHEVQKAESVLRAACRSVPEISELSLELSLALAQALRRQQREGEAILLYRSLRERFPQSALVAHRLGIVLVKRGDWVAAEQAYQDSLAINPRQAAVYNDWGHLYSAQKKVEAARECFQKATELDPEFAPAWSNLGAMCHHLKQLPEAQQALERALQLQPHQPGALFNYANLLCDLGQSEQAMTYYQAALEEQPDQLDFKMNYAVAANHLGQFEKAIQLCREITAQDPLYADAYFTLLTFHPHVVTDVEVQHVEQLLEKSSLEQNARANIYFGLGKHYDERGDYERAFTAFQAGNELSSRRHQFDYPRLQNFVDQLIDIFTPEYFRSVPGPGSCSTQPIFILGMPRSGSTLVDQILVSHAQVTGAGEFDGIRRLVQQFLTLSSVDAVEGRKSRSATYPESARELTSRLVQQMAEDYLQRLGQTAGPALRMTDKMPNNVFHLGLIATLFPQATVIYTERDALDICLSCYFQNFRAYHHFSFDLRNTARYYLEHVRLMQHWQNVLPLKIHTVTYEKLVQDQLGETRWLIEEVCGLPWDEECLKFYQHRRPVFTASLSQVRQPIYHQSSGRWKNYRRYIGPLLEELGISESQLEERLAWQESTAATGFPA